MGNSGHITMLVDSDRVATRVNEDTHSFAAHGLQLCRLRSCAPNCRYGALRLLQQRGADEGQQQQDRG